MVDSKTSSILAVFMIVVVAIVIFKYADMTLDISSSSGGIFSMIFFLAAFYLVFRFLWKKE